MPFSDLIGSGRALLFEVPDPRLFPRVPSIEVKLCRFDIVNRPGDEPRSGVFHEGKIYETDGQNALGVHDPANIRFLCPIGRPPIVRCFESYQAGPGEHALSYFYSNPVLLSGPDATIELPPSVDQADLEIRVFGVVQDSAMLVDEREADSLILGYGFMVVLVDRELEGDSGGNATEHWTSSRDMGAWVSPFLVTPDELNPHLASESKSRFKWEYQIHINDEQVGDRGQFESDYAFSDLLYLGSRRSTLSTGEVLTWPALPKTDLEVSDFGRMLMPGDTLRIVVDGLGAVTGRIG